MYEYFLSLYDTFFRPPECRELRQELSDAHDSIHQKLDRAGQKELLRYLDGMNELRDDVALAAFVAGFRLAHGVEAELNRSPAFSFEAEEMRRVHEKRATAKNEEGPET